MKTPLKLLTLITACHALLGAQAMAKKGDKDDSETKKNERREQGTNGGSGTVTPGIPQQPKQNPKPKKAQQGPKQPGNPNFTPPKKSGKPRDAKNPNKNTPKKADVPPKRDQPPGSAGKRKKGDEPNVKRKTKNDPADASDSPGKRPGADKPSGDKPGNDQARKDGKKSKPDASMPLPGKRPNVPGAGKDKAQDPPDVAKRDKKPDSKGPAKPGENKTKKQVVVRPGQNTKQVKGPNVARNTTNNWWNKNTTRNDVRVKNVTNVTQINNNFSQNVNWSTRRNHWGYNPWWNRPVVRPWYGSSWNCGWSTTYYHRHYHYGHVYAGYRPPGYYVDNHDVAAAIGWGLVGWSLGAMIYDTGYRTYYNPYPVRPVYVSSGVQVTYTEPITQVAVRSAPEEDSAVEEITRKSESLIAESQTAFKQRNYLVALELADKAIAESPGDGALHEYRALVLFALGRYGDAAGVLNPVLASGPGWDWSTMVALYDAQETYTDQLQRLEAYTEEKPDAADTHFLLGYHYMVCGHLDLATPQFDLAHKLMPSDNLSKELAELTRNSAKPGDKPDEKPAEAAEEPEVPESQPVPLEKLTGTWVSSKDAGSSITLAFKDDGKFTWSYLKDGKTTEFSGEYSMNDDGLLVLDSEESQMVASVELPQDSELKFVLAGGPPADPGLAFKKN